MNVPPNPPAHGTAPAAVPLQAAVPLPTYQREPLGLPAGSVRAVLAFTVLGLIAALLLVPEEKPAPMPLFLFYLFFLVLGHYFAVRGRQAGAARHPLFLPRGAIRFLLLVVFMGVVGWAWYHNPRDFAERMRMTTVAEQPYLPLLLVGGFFLGVIVNKVSHWLLAGPTGLPPWLQDLQAWVALLAMLGLGAEVLIRLVINPSMERQPDLAPWEGVLAAVVAFYFGVRS